MYWLMAYLALNCGNTTFINQTKDPWNFHDKTIFNRAKKHCGELYKDAPCVKKLYKRPEDSYWVICSEEIKIQ